MLEYVMLHYIVFILFLAGEFVEEEIKLKFH